MGTERRDGMRGIGPEVKSDTIFRRRMRRHQGWYRDHVLGVPYGRGTNRRQGKPLGNMLTKASAELGLNFLTRGIFEVAKRRIAKGAGAVDPYRLLHNMLSSQPMCFNLFGELALDVGLATRLTRSLWGEHIGQVRRICFEWAPTPAPLKDRTAFDAFIEYDVSGGGLGFIGIEIKLTEPFSPKRHNRPEYRHWMTDDAPWRLGVDPSSRPHNQLWRNHLLGWSLLQHRDSVYVRGEVTVVYHPEDKACRRAIDGYTALLRDESTFSSFDLANILSSWTPLAGDWLQSFERRYLAMDEGPAADA